MQLTTDVTESLARRTSTTLSAGSRQPNPKSETRNPKQIRNPNDRNSKRNALARIVSLQLFVSVLLSAIIEQKKHNFQDKMPNQ
jgi:hypothetical protein